MTDFWILVCVFIAGWATGYGFNSEPTVEDQSIKESQDNE